MNILKNNPVEIFENDRRLSIVDLSEVRKVAVTTTERSSDGGSTMIRTHSPCRQFASLVNSEKAILSWFWSQQQAWPLYRQ